MAERQPSRPGRRRRDPRAPRPRRVPRPCAAQRRRRLYDASAIQVLEGLEAVRKRPGMYIGSTGERGLHHLIWEIVDNAVDESLAGHCDRIVVTLQADGGVRVEDNGRGIPTDTAPGQDMPAVTMALTMLHAGGKFGGGGYKVSGGLHGVGVSVVNALSTTLIVEVRNRGHLWRQTFSHRCPRRRPRADPADGAGRAHRHHRHLLGLRRHLRDDDLLARDDHQPDPRVRVPQQGPGDRHPRRAPGRRGARSTPSRTTRSTTRSTRPARDAIKGEGGGLEQVFKYDRGLVDYVEHLNRRKDKANPTIISFEAETPDDPRDPHESRGRDAVEHLVHRVRAHLRQRDQHPRGRHPRGGLPRRAHQLVNHWGEEWGLIKKHEDRVSGDDIRQGLTAIISIKLGEPQFEGQTKTKLGNTKAEGFVQRIMNDQLGDVVRAEPRRGP